MASALGSFSALAAGFLALALALFTLHCQRTANTVNLHGLHLRALHDLSRVLFKTTLDEIGFSMARGRTQGAIAKSCLSQCHQKLVLQTTARLTNHKRSWRNLCPNRKPINWSMSPSYPFIHIPCSLCSSQKTHPTSNHFQTTRNTQYQQPGVRGPVQTNSSPGQLQGWRLRILKLSTEDLDPPRTRGPVIAERKTRGIGSLNHGLPCGREKREFMYNI